MKKLFLILFLSWSTICFASNNREHLNWIEVYCDGKCCYNTRQYLLLTQGENLQKKGCKIIKGEWHSFYLNTKHTEPAQVEIDHVLPWSWIYQHGANKLNLETQKEIYNDLENLVIASKKENRSKSSLLNLPFAVPEDKEREYKEIQCKVCLRWDLEDCDEFCNG